MSFLDWKVGDKIVCLGNPDWSSKYQLPQAGKVYTISMIAICAFTGEVGVGLDEMPLQDSLVTPGYKIMFQARCFRPVQVRKTSIAVFERLLNPSDADSFRELEAEEFDYSDAVPFQ